MDGKNELLQDRILKNNGNNSFLKISLLKSLNKMIITFCFNEIIVREMNEEGNTSFRVKNIRDLVEDDIILTVIRTGENDLDPNEISFKKYSDHQRGKSTEKDMVGFQEYINFAIKTVESRYGNVDIDITTVLENCKLTIIPVYKQLETKDRVELFRKYLDSYLPEMNGVLSKAIRGEIVTGENNRIGIGDIYGGAFENYILGQYKIPVWTYSLEDIFIDDKNKIIAKLLNSKIDATTSGDFSRFLFDYNKKQYRFRYKTYTRPNKTYTQDYAYWIALTPAVLESNGIKNISELTDMMEG